MRAVFVLILVLVWAQAAAAADVVAARTLRVGTVIAQGDLEIAPSVPADVIERLHGLEMRKTVYAGRPITKDALGPPILVQRNDVLMMTYAAGGLMLRTEGRALGAGGLGEHVEVMNLDTRVVVRATVSGVRRVEVNP